MTLNDFINSALPVLEAFKQATLEHNKTDKTFYLERNEIDWWKEVLAYMQYTELESDNLE